MLTELRVRSLLLGLVCYLSAWLLVAFSLSVYATLTMSHEETTRLSGPIISVVTVLMFTSGGIVAGFSAGERGLLHGFVVGLMGGLIIASAISILFSGEGYPSLRANAAGYVLPSVILTTLGGAVGAFLKRKRRTNEK